MIARVRPESTTIERDKTASAGGMEIDVLHLLQRQWLKFPVCLLIGWVIAVAYCTFSQTSYESSSQILLMPKDPNLAAKGLDGSKDVNSTLSEDLLSTHMMLLQSPAIVGGAVESADLSKLPSLVASMGPKERTPVDYIIKSMAVTRGGSGKAKNAQILRVSMRHSNAEDAQRIVAAIVSEFQEFIKRKFVDVNQSAAELIVTNKSQLQQDLQIAEKRFREFRENAPMLWNGEKGANMYRSEYEQTQHALTELRMEKSQLETRFRLVELQLKAIDARGGSDLERLALIDNKNAERVRVFIEIYGGKTESELFQSQQPERSEVARGEFENLLKLKSRQRTLIADYGPEHPEVKLVREEINAVEQFLNSKSDKLKLENSEEKLTPRKLVDSYLKLMKNDLETLNSRERVLMELSDKAEAEAKALVRFELEGESLKSTFDRQKSILDASVDRLREVNLAKDVGGFFHETIAEAELGQKVWPRLSICLAIGTIMGLGLGGLAALVSEYRNDSLRSKKEVESISGVPVLSVIPVLSSLQGYTNRPKVNAGLDVHPALCTIHSPQSRESEVFRGLRTSLLCRAASMDAKVIAVTSPLLGDGKSTLIANLAYSIAQVGKSVLLIEADMRRQTMSNIIGLESIHGLSTVLQGDCLLGDAVHRLEQNPNLSVLTAGPNPKNPAELLASNSFRKLVEEAKTQFGMVLIDCPPVLAVSDPTIVSGVVDAMLIAIRTGKNSRSELLRTVELLAEVNALVIGTVINASSLESGNESTIASPFRYSTGARYTNRLYFEQSAWTKTRA